MDQNFDDEVIADSEGEEGEPMMPISMHDKQEKRIAAIANTSTVSEFPATKSIPETISEFSANAANRSAISKDSAPSESSARPRPRPKPRPKYKGALANAMNESSPSSNAVGNDSINGFTSMPSLSIADRAKLRARDSKARASGYDASGTSSDSIQQPQNSKRFLPNPSEIIELSDDDELAFRPTVAQIANRSKKSQSTRKTVNHIAPSPDSSPQAYLPIATSPILAGASSQLPPSDPPQSTSEFDYPPIVTLPNPHSDSNAPSSSPFSPPPKISRSKRRPRIEELDELDFNADEIDIDKQIMPPPPVPAAPSNFFASSSPPIVPRVEAIDLCTPGPSSNANESFAPPPVKEKLKKPRKKQVESNAGDAVKAKATKAKSKVKATLLAQVDVVINLPPKKGKSKGKSSQKQQAQEVFKSREFIDEEELEDNSNLSSHVAPATAALAAASDVDTNTRQEDHPQKRNSDTFEGGEDVEAPPRKKQKTKVDANSSQKGKGKGKGRIVLSDEEEETNTGEEIPEAIEHQTVAKPKRASEISSDKAGSSTGNAKTTKENVDPSDLDSSDPVDRHAAAETPVKETRPSLSSRYSIAPRTKSTPMSELIRKVNSLPGSPFYSPAPRGSSAKPSTMGTAYSPYLKSSRSMLSRIAPLHPNRRTPPPPLPPPPPRKKTKKEIEREEQWEEELIESVGGITEWACMTDQERKEARRVKREREMSGWED